MDRTLAAGPDSAPRRLTRFDVFDRREAGDPLTVRVDPEGHEIEALSDLVELGGREVLEIGCGDGRLTWRYADATAHVTAIDPFPDAIERARKRLAQEPDERIEFRRVAFEDFASSNGSSTFDVTILSWSLC
jgi:2-polyprenyl-3-methyl-5-hydroxy-6-metoxy-1,4-benzoquinol methylase